MKRTALLLCLAALCLAMTSRSLLAQDYLTATGNPTFGVNIPVENGFINVTNGNLHLEFHLATHKQRGALNLDEKLVYDSRIWMIGHYSNYYWWPTNVPNTTIDQGGWRFVTGAETGTMSYIYASGSSTDVQCPVPPYNSVDTITVETPSWSDPSGTVHTFAGTLTTDDNQCAGTYTQTVQAGSATDGSGYQMIGDSSGNPVIVDNNGTQVYPQVTDRYGNYWSTDANGNLIDDLGRTPVIVTKNGNVTYYDVLAPNGPIDNNGLRVRYTVTTAPIQINTAFNEQPVQEWSGTLSPVQSIQLPDGSSYSFSYDSYGEMTSITLPTGGVINYGWSNYFDSYQNENRWLTSRVVGSNPPMTFTPSVLTQCSSNGVGCQEQVNVHRPSGDETVYKLTLNNGAWNTNTTIYNGSAQNGQAIEGMTNTYDFSHACTTPVCSGAQYITKSAAVTALLDTGFQSQTQYVYNSPWSGKPDSIKEWDFYTGSLPSTPSRETDYTYNAYDITQETTLSNGTQVAQTTYGYTGSATGTSGVTQHGTSNVWNPYLQTVTKLLNPNPNSLPTTTTYVMDDTGMVRSVTDPKGNQSSTTYQCSNALPYQATNALSQVTTYGYDCNSGALTGTKDPNDLAAGRAGTTYQYESTAGRLQTVNYPDGGQKSYSYPSPAEVDTSTLATPDPTISSQDIADAYDRPSQHIQAGVSSETTYDVNGRTSCVTNPHFPSSPSYTDGSTCMTTYDGLDRPKKQTQPDGNALTWSYSGNVTTSTDEANHSWQRTSNAFGQLTNVVEPGNLQTSYSYDGLGNLSNVTQTGVSGEIPRTHSFSYDSLSRLTSAANPETGTINYSYDPNGNLLTKTDARGVTTSYSYDALNRVTNKQSAGASGVPGFNYVYWYDKSAPGGIVASNPIGHLTWASNDVNADNQYSYDSMGRVINQGGCTPQRCVLGANPVSAQYDLAGNMTSLTYPDGRTISQMTDAAGRVSSVNYASWNGTGHTYSYLNSNALPEYDPAGHLINATMGNGTSLAAAYDNRGRTGLLAYGAATQLLWGKQYGWSANSNLQTLTDALTGVQRQFGYDNLNRITAAQDMVGSAQGADTSPFPVGSGNTTPGSSSGATPTPSWTDPDDSNVLLNPDTPGATGWGSANATIVGSVMAPDGTTTASSFTATSGSGDTYVTDVASNQYLYDGITMTGSVWLRSPNGNQTVDLFLVENGTAGFDIPAGKSITVTSTWQQFQISGQYHYGHDTIFFQIGGGGTITSGQTISLWGAKLEDTGSSGVTVTNFLPYSQRLTAPTWGFQNGSATDNSATAPDGTNTAATVTANSNSSGGWFVDNVPNPAPYSGVPITGSVWLRSTTGPQSVLLTLIDVSAQTGYSTLGLTTVTITDDWQRFQVTGTNANTLTELELQIGGGTTFMNGQSFQVWGAQVELGSTASAYVATAANPVSTGSNLTNILSYSQQPNGPSWSNTYNFSGVPNAVLAPDGSQTGYEATAVADVGWLTNDVPNPALYNNTTLTESVFLRSPSGSGSIVVYLLGWNASGWALFQSVPVNLTSTWQRVTLTGQAPNGMTRLYLQIGSSLVTGQVIDVWGSQMEIAPTAGPYVMTSVLPVVAGSELTNILPNSQQLNGPSWGVVNGSLSINSAVAPDGTSTAATVTATAPAYVIDDVPNPSLYDEQTVTGSVYLRVPSGTLNTNIYLINVGENGWSEAGEVAVTLTTTWQRFSVTGTNQNGLTQLGLQIAGGGAFTTGQSIQIWGTQMVVGTDSAPYTPTISGTTSPVTGQPATLLPTGLNQTYSYDSFGNLQQNGSFSSIYTANNQMFGYAYDAAGNLLSNGFTSMTWDAESRLISAGGATYVYDPEGNRVGTQGVGVTDTIYFGGRPIARYSAGGWTDLIYGPNGLLAEVPGSENAEPVYRLTDHLGSDIGTVGNNGILTNPLDYTPFGQIFSGTTSDAYTFTGLERDQETGLDHAEFRQYSSTVGRWMSPDPYDGSMDIRYPQTLNRYAYVGNNPLSFIDPSGLSSTQPVPCGTSSNGNTMYCMSSTNDNSNSDNGEWYDPVDWPSMFFGLFSSGPPINKLWNVKRPNDGPTKPGFLSCTFTGKVGMSLGTTTLDAVGIIPGAGNVLHGVQFGAGLAAAGFSVFGSLPDAGLSATGVGLSLAETSATNIAVHGTELIPIVGNVVSAGATLHDIFGSEGLIANYKGCIAGTHP